MNLLPMPKITLFYAGVLGIMYFLLSVNVIRYRWKEKKGLGHETHPKDPLFRAIRIHGNFMEYVPFILLLLALDEVTTRGEIFLHAMGLGLIIARIFHFLGITKSHLVSWQRSAGVGITFIILLVLSVNLILKGASEIF